jgi:ABC-type multidrug transport system fused ATPase/permease subunit
MCVAALLEAGGAVAVFVLLQTILDPARAGTSAILAPIRQTWSSDDPRTVTGALTAVVAALYVVRAVYLVGAEKFKEQTVGLSAAQAAERLFSKYLAAEYLFHLRRRSSTLIQDVARATDVAFQLVAASALNILAELATIAALLVVLARAAPPQALWTVAFVLAVATIPIVTTRRLWVRSGEAQKVLEEQQLHVLQQSLGAVKEVRIAGRESFFESRLRTARRALADVRQRRLWIATALRLGVETVLIVCLLGVVWVVTMRGASGAETASLVALFAYTGFRVVPSANRIMLNAGYVREGRAFARAALADFSAPELSHSRSRAFDAGMEFNQSLTFENVSFAYEPGGPPAISSVHLTIGRGESIAIVGPTGSGKSTLVDVLLGLLPPTSGRVTVDGRDLAGHERAWYKLVGYVPQDLSLLDESLRRNIAFGIPDAMIDEQRVARACALAQLDEVVRQLPDGLETALGENGTRLSGGQRQRVAIARALYNDPAVLVFDEATAALDPQTEREVTQAIDALHGTRTVIVIAHRLSTVQRCDRLIFLQDGRIAEVGTYQQLLQHPAFRAMALP